LTIALIAQALARLRSVSRIGVVLGNSRDEPAVGERLQVGFQCVGNFLGIDLLAVHVERERFQVFFFLRRVRDRRLRPLVKRVVFDPLLFGCGDILRKGVKLAFCHGAMRGKNFEQRFQRRVTVTSAKSP